MMAPRRWDDYRASRYLTLVIWVVALWAISTFGFQGIGYRNEFNIFLDYGLLTLGFYWVYGLSGQFSIAHVAFAGIGAYTSAFLTRQGIPIPLSIVLAMAVTAVISILFLLFVYRASAFYFAIATLGFGSIAVLVLQQWQGFTGARGGEQSNVALFRWNGELLTAKQLSSLYLVILTVGLVVATLINQSPLYRNATALKYNPEVARTCGVSDLGVRITMFGLGCGTAALAGALLGHSNGFLAPESFQSDLALGVFLMLVVGGDRFMFGPLVGAAFYVFFPTVLGDVGLSQWQNLIYGLTLLAFMIFLPSGTLGGLHYLKSVVGAISLRSGPDRLLPATDSREPTPLVPAPIEQSEAVSGDTWRLAARNVTVDFRGVRALDDVTISVKPGEVLGVVGPNGSGKSTLLNAITGLVDAQGELRIDGIPCPLGSPGRARRVGVMRSFQTPQVYEDLSSRDNIALADGDRRATGLFAALFRPLAVARREHERDVRVRSALAELGCPDLWGRRITTMSYGERRWVELARVTAANARIVLLDEPSAGLNDAETGRLVDFIHGLRVGGATIVIVDHKIDLIASVSDRVAVLDFGRLIAMDRPDEVFNDPRVIEAYLGADLQSETPN
jgi:branched-chain amino acid transport system permease protein